MDLFKSDLLKTYWQNTAENRSICSITALQYRKLLLLEGLENLFFCSLIWYTLKRFIQLDFFLICVLLKRYRQNTAKIWLFLVKMFQIRLWKSSVVSLCSSLRARLNAFFIFFQDWFVEEISRKYCRKSGIALKPYVYPITQQKLPIGKNGQFALRSCLFYSLPYSLVCVRYFTNVTILSIFAFSCLFCTLPYTLVCFTFCLRAFM